MDGSQTVDDGTEAVDRQQYLTFTLRTELFAIGIRRVKEILEYGRVTAVPMMPECIRGVINLRGAVVPVVDLAVLFWRQNSKASRRTCIVIIEGAGDGGSQDIGIVVDAVNEVLEIRDEDIEPPPALGNRLKTDFVSGMGKVNDRFVIIFDVDNTLSFDGLAAEHEKHLAAASGLEAPEAA
jgi:purine-binding chemotaxis protein CheW